MSNCAAGLKARAVSLFACIVSTCVAAPSLRAQNVIHVPTDQTTIQAAINAANNGDTVLVAPGTYVENINFGGKAITVTSSGGPSVTTIDGGAHGSVVTFNSSEALSSVLSGFTITNGLQIGLSGAGIHIVGTSPTITGNVITGNHAAVGIGIEVNGGSPLIQNNTITGNNQQGAGDGGEGGGGILVDGSSTSPAAPQILSNTITNNSVSGGGNGGGISVTYFSSPLIENNWIQGNTAYNNGGGISVQSYNSPVVVQNVIIANSTLGGGSGAGIWVSPNSSPETYLNNTIGGNIAFDNTSGIYITGFGQYATFTNNIVVAASGEVAVTCNSLYSSISPFFSYNDSSSSSGQNWSGICDTTSQPGNISADPQFLNAGTDFHLQWGSPAVDAGNNSAPNLPVSDFDGNPRVVDGNGDGIATVDLGAYELSPTTISLAPNSLTFGPQRLGSTSAAQTVILNNTGNQKLLFAISIDSNFAQTNNCGPALAAGATCSVNVVFSPTVTGNITGNLTLRDTASGNPHVVALAGTGGAPAASLTPSNLDFGSQQVATTSSPQAMTLSNTGDAAMAVSGITASGDFAQTSNCGSTLAVGASCSINVTFTPTAMGARSGSLTVTDSASDSPQSIPLTGTGTAPIASLAPSSVNFGAQLVGTTSAAQSATLSNTGTAPLSISAIIASGDFAQTNNCGSTLAAGASCSINVTFTPNAASTRSGSLTVTDNASGSPQSVSLTGTGTAPVASLAPSSLNFGAQLVGTTSAAQSATLSNTSTAPLSISGITASGDFAQTNNCGTTLAAGANCSITVTFTPPAAGTRSGSLTVTDNSSGSPQSVSLTGTGTVPVASVSPSALAFPNQYVGTTSAPMTVTLSNSGNGALSITSIGINGGPFSQTNNCPSSLVAGSSCAINVSFSPVGRASVTGTLVITDNASGSPQTVGLSGTGIAPVASFSPAALSFAPQMVTTASAPQSITLSNVGTAPMTINSISTTTTDFAFTTGCGTSLSVGASCLINVTFAPSTWGSRSGLLVISESADSSPQPLGLTGTGLDFYINVTPNSVALLRGTSYNFTVSVTPLGGTFPNAIALSCSGLPAESTCAFSPASITPGSSGASSLMTLTTDKNKTPTGNYTVIITGVSGRLVHSTQVQLSVFSKH